MRTLLFLSLLFSLPAALSAMYEEGAVQDELSQIFKKKRKLAHPSPPPLRENYLNNLERPSSPLLEDRAPMDQNSSVMLLNIESIERISSPTIEDWEPIQRNSSPGLGIIEPSVQKPSRKESPDHDLRRQLFIKTINNKL